MIPNAPSHNHTHANSSANNRTLPPSVFTLPPTAQLEALYTIIRNKDTSRGDLLFYSDRIIRLLVEEGLNHLPVIKKSVVTPTGATYDGVGFEGKICGVSILRAGEAMEAGLREVCRSMRISKILIKGALKHLVYMGRRINSWDGFQDEETAQPKLFYSKFPQDIAKRYVLLLDPMLATGGSAMKAVDVLMEHGVGEERIIFINLISSPEGLKTFCAKFPRLKVITGWIDQGLNEKAYIIPGLGDFGERSGSVEQEWGWEEMVFDGSTGRIAWLARHSIFVHDATLDDASVPLFL
ncbi:hypothetical protein D9757_010628 [Collybiopsis confluens]|uniref:uracil phosphoribosyltransferase n=1 Tax=Collybiopsis confluens TaxID=2823264 RepID=A0A8H5GS45_9AGAR|nr:hypothetical protein D9757_010628 [Collybiopsis confluens]